MKPILLLALVAACAPIALAQKPKAKPAAKPAAAVPMTGLYEGAITLPNTLKLRMVFRFDGKGAGTWWMFWRDGYAAMAALDDNHDGWLTGRELSGLALWFDRNQNGVSEPGEMVPIAQTPVTGLATTATGEESGSPRNTAGLRLHDGSTLPTWDWVVLDRPG